MVFYIKHIKQIKIHRQVNKHKNDFVLFLCLLQLHTDILRLLNVDVAQNFLFVCHKLTTAISPTASKPFMDDNCAVNAITILLFGLASSTVRNILYAYCSQVVCVGVSLYIVSISGRIHIATISKNCLRASVIIIVLSLGGKTLKSHFKSDLYLCTDEPLATYNLNC